MAEDNSIRDLVEKLLAEKEAAKAVATKKNRTLYLSNPGFTALQTFCKSKGYSVGVLVDKLIENFLNELDPNWRKTGA